MDEQNENIGENHKNIAKIKRKALMNQQYRTDEVMGTDLKIQAKGIIQELQEVQPIIFEECFVSEKDPKFVQMVKQSSELTENRIRECFANSGKTLPQTQCTVGVHLFVM